MLTYTPPEIIYGDTTDISHCKYVFVVFSYNFGERITRCLRSVERAIQGQNAGILILDDGSSSISNILDFCQGTSVPCLFWHFKDNQKKAHNLYALSKEIPELDTVLVFIDGDDYLNNEVSVLSVLDSAYSSIGCQATLGSFKVPPGPGQREHILSALQFPKRMDFRYLWDPDRCWCWCHLKTMKSKILFAIEEEYFTEADGLTFIKKGDDNLLLPRGFQLARQIKVIDEVLYIYDTSDDHFHIDDIDRYSYVRGVIEGKIYKSFSPKKHLDKDLSPWRKESGKDYKNPYQTQLLSKLNKRLNSK